MKPYEEDSYERYYKRLAFGGRQGYYAVTSPYISHVKLKKAIKKTPAIVEKIKKISGRFCTEKSLIKHVQFYEDVKLLTYTLKLLEEEGLLEALCYLFALGAYKNRKRTKQEAYALNRLDGVRRTAENQKRAA